MDVQRAIERRRMVRNFADRPVATAVRDRILSNATRAPSAGFTQGWQFLVLEQPQDRMRFWDIEWPRDERDASRRTGVMNASLVVVPFADKQAYLDRYAEPDKGWTDRDESRWPVPFWQVDTAFATMLMLLTVTDEGLGALFFGLHRPEEIMRSFGVPRELAPIGALAIGHPESDEPSPSLARGRKPWRDVAHLGRW